MVLTAVRDRSQNDSHFLFLFILLVQKYV